MPRTALSDAEVTEKLTTLNGWTYDGSAISKTIEVETYLTGVALASAVGVLCEGMDHHPDLYIGWRRVRISFSTHDAGDKVTERDIAAARAVDGLGYPRQ